MNRSLRAAEETADIAAGKQVGKRQRPRTRKPKPGNGAAPTTAGALLDREAVLYADDLPSERVAIPEWDGDVMVQALPLAERSSFEEAATDKDSSSHEVMCRIVALSCCNPDGTRMFSQDDALLLAQKAPDPIMRLMKAATRVNALTERYVEELAKN